MTRSVKAIVYHTADSLKTAKLELQSLAKDPREYTAIPSLHLVNSFRYSEVVVPRDFPQEGPHMEWFAEHVHSRMLPNTVTVYL